MKKLLLDSKLECMEVSHLYFSYNISSCKIDSGSPPSPIVNSGNLVNYEVTFSARVSPVCRALYQYYIFEHTLGSICICSCKYN